jgi:hypothetical protein
MSALGRTLAETAEEARAKVAANNPQARRRPRQHHTRIMAAMTGADPRTRLALCGVDDRFRYSGGRRAGLGGRPE